MNVRKIDQRIMRIGTNEYKGYSNYSCSFVLFVVIFFLSMALASGLYAQEFGFGFDGDGGEAASSPPVSVKIGGEIETRLTGYVHDFSSVEKIKEEKVNFGDIISGKLNFSASGANVDAFIGLNLSAESVSDIINYNPGDPVYTPLILDEAYLKAFFGPVNIEAGLRKLTWGRADSMGPLDVINPLDNTDLLNIDDLQEIKIARPLVHVSWNTGDFSKLEAVFIPNFTGLRFAREGRWAPSQFSTMAETVPAGILDKVLQKFPPALAPIIEEMYFRMAGDFPDFLPDFPDTSGLEYFQTGLRFTATVGSADIGVQYFYGNLFQPDFSVAGVDTFVDGLYEDVFVHGNMTDPGDTGLLSPKIKYNRYHQIGLDYAQVLFGFNVRAEFAVHLTEDLKGGDGSVRNPFLAWSLGFDRDLFWGINANIQCNETIRLMNDKVGANPATDCEAGTEMTSTRFTMRFSKKFLKDELESRVTVIWGVEDSDCYVIPALAWNIRDVSAELAAGVFAGNTAGELGQFWENSFVRLGLKYTF